MLSLRQRLAEGPCLFLDGGLGTWLMARGLAPGRPPEGWTLERPEIVLECHRAYVAAGSQAVQTNTFGANPLRLAHFGWRERGRELNLRAVELARRAGADYVLGDLGPSGLYLPPVGSADPEALRESALEQAGWLAEAGVDGFHIETMTDLREARLVLSSVLAVSSQPVLVSLSFASRKRGFFTPMGDPPLASLTTLLKDGASVAGANCTLGSAAMAELAEQLGGLRPVLQPNAGQPALEGDQTVYHESPQEFAGNLSPLLPVLAAVGGCCGTSPEFIAELRRSA